MSLLEIDPRGCWSGWIYWNTQQEEAEVTGEPDWSETDEWRDRYGWSLDEEESIEPEWAGDVP